MTPHLLAGRSAGRRMARGMSLVGVLLFLVVAYGIYAMVFKPGDKKGDTKTVGTEPMKPRVVIYTRPACEPCDRAKLWMTQNRIAFEERNVEGSAKHEEELKDYKSRIVPVIVVNDEPQYGFMPAHLEQILRKPSPGQR